ncbi:uncharacterized protein LOC102808236 [Saccoglossus kowalevskii]|uniref:Uncharacterized protein LOC102808236 n=1 Tax=Saccoglossus kowalevskii TaxID=10224 RepID=A0ABM0MNE1_SACKO|nr:PREDICTED: uncharacterized protein LOC102808236 [Saccoglossus kowalevskii]
MHYPKEKIKQMESNVLYTKREIVRQTSRLFDPLGYLAPVHVKAIQKLWKSGLSWDTQISTQLSKEWESIRINLDHVKETSIKRTYFTESNNNDCELHVFAVFRLRCRGVFEAMCQ